jgi:integrase
MALKKRGCNYYSYFRIHGKQVGVKLETPNKSEATRIETVLLRAVRLSDYGGLDPTARAAAIRLFENQGWELPAQLNDHRPTDNLTLVRSVELFLKYPTVRSCKAKARYAYCLENLMLKLGREKSVKDIWAPEIRLYQAERLAENAAPTTINWETSTLSRLFGVLMELKLVEANPCRLVKQLSRKTSERQAYVALTDVQRIAEKCPEWFRRIIWTAYYSGMRRSEILELRRPQVNLGRRTITLSPAQTKEAAWKKIPIHKALTPIFEDALRVTALGSDHVFLVQDKNGVRPIGVETAKNPWRRACDSLKLPKPWPHLHDLRHSFKTNARLSGMDPEIREGILGHSTRVRSVSERYGLVRDEELVTAIDAMSFDHGTTQILVAR